MCDRLRQRNTNGNDNGNGNHGKGLIMKKTLGLLAALVITLGIGTASAAYVYWVTDSATATWTNPDSDDFSTAPIGGSGSPATYNNGDIVQFGNGFSGTLPTNSTAISFAAGGVNPAKIVMYTPRGVNRITFNIGEDNALGTGSFDTDYTVFTTFNNTKDSQVTLANNFIYNNAYSLVFTGGDFRLTGTVSGGGNGGPTFRPAAGITLTLDNGISGASGFSIKPTVAGSVVRINGTSSSWLYDANADVTIQVGADNALGPSAALAGQQSDVRTSTKLEAVGGPRTLSNNFVSRGMQVIGSHDLTLNGQFAALGNGWISLYKYGSSTLTLGGDNGSTHYGAVSVREGVVRLSHANALGVSPVIFSGGVLELGTADFNYALTMSPQYTDGSTVGWLTSGIYGGSGGFSAYGADRIVNLGGASAGVTWGAGGFVPSGQSLVFGSGTANAQLDFQNPISLGASGTNTRTIQVNDNPGSTADVALLSNTLSGSSGNSLNKTGPGTLILAGDNTYAGTTIIAVGMLRADHANALGVGGDIILAGGTLQYTATSASQDWGSRLKNSTAAIQLDTNGQAVSLSGIDASNSGGLSKLGTGTLTLAGTHTYTGPTALAAGTLLVNGSTATGSAVQVNGGTLGGSGIIGGTVTVNAGGTLSPGASIESLGSGALTLNDGSTFAYELDTASLNGDLLYVDGGVTFDGTVTLTLAELAAGKVAVGDKLTLIASTAPWSGSLFTYEGSLLAAGAIFDLGVNKWQFAYNDTTGGMNFAADQVGMNYFITMTAIPEPAAGLLLALGGLLARRRRRG